MAALPSCGVVGTATMPSWETDWDEEDQADQQRQKVRKTKRSLTPPATPPAAPPPEIPDRWDDTDPETLVDNSKPKPKPKPKLKPEDKFEAKPLTDRPAETLSAKPLSDREVIAPAVKDTAPAVKVKLSIEKRYWGKVMWFRGCYGWVTSHNVRTDRTVNPQGYSLTEISNAIYLHKNDCQGFVARYGMDVNFRVEPDTHGKLKCADVRQERQEDQRMTLDTYLRATRENKEQVPDSKSLSTEQIADSKPRATISGHGTQDAFKPPHKANGAKLSRDVSSDGPQSWFEARMEATRKPPQTASQAKLSRSNLELHHQETGSCSSSTAPGLTSCSASVVDVTFELDVQSQDSALDMGNKWADRPKYTPRHIHSSIVASIVRVSGYVEIEEPTEEAAPDQPPVAESWEDEKFEEALDRVFDARRTERTVDSSGYNSDHGGAGIVVSVDTKEANANLQVDEQNVGEKNVQGPSDETQSHESPATFPKLQRRQLVNRKLAKPKAAPQEGQLAQFCRAMGPQFPFEVVARHLGADFDAIVQRASDVHSLDSLVQAGMKPLHRNKFCNALRQEKEQRATRGESPKHDLAGFRPKIGPVFDHVFLADSLGIDNLDEIIMRITDFDDFEVLVVAGMKPFLKNKLYRQLALERKRRATER